MEDISRELEREIARIKPAPHKMRKENRILIINDFGEMRSGSFLKILVCFFLVISMAGGFCTIIFYQLYAKADNQNVQLKRSRDVLEKKVDRLTSEKEVLMARLVVTGNTAELDALIRTGRIGQNSPKKEARPNIKGKKDSAGPLSPDVSPALKRIQDEGGGPEEQKSALSRQAQSAAPPDRPVQKLSEALPSVSVESFSLSRGSRARDVVIRFNIRNVTRNSTEISGRIFCVLKPKGATPDLWVVIPKAHILDGNIPGPYKQGHYFSISHFKPVQFTVNTRTPLQDFADVSVYIFDETEKLLSKTTFEIGKN